MQMLEGQLQQTRAFAAGAEFSLADVVLGLSCVRWKASPMERPLLPAVEAYMDRLRQRPGFLRHGDNGMP